MTRRASPSLGADGPRAAGRGAREPAPRFAVRRAGVDDVGRAVPLFDAYRRFYGAAGDVAAARAFLAARLAGRESVVLLASRVPSGGAGQEPAGPDDGDTIGFAQLYASFSSVSLGPIVVLNDLFVVPAWRRAGVGRRLVEESATRAAQFGAIRLELATQSANAPARRLYASLGFTPDREFTHLSLALNPAYPSARPRP